MVDETGDPKLIAPGRVWVSTEQLAHRYGKTKRWVINRAHLLGGAPVSPGARNSKLHYHLPTADSYMASTMLPANRAPDPVRRRTRSPEHPERTRNGAALLSFRL